MKTETIEIHNQLFELHPSGAIFWKQKSMLLIADVHLGKVSHFRKHGSAVPKGAITENFNQLNAVIDFFKPKKIYFLGDLFHSYLNNEWLFFETWVSSLDCKFVLVAGNHDIISDTNYNKLNIDVCKEIMLEKFLLTHHPEEREGFFNFSGHIHPGVVLLGMGRQRLKVSCFFKKESQLILPAFGSFTGKFILQPTKKDEVFAITNDEVISLNI